ncbi:MAG: alpha-galactosidase [Actinomycetota bacterium]
MPEALQLNVGSTTLAVSAGSGMPTIVHYGGRLDGFDSRALDRPVPRGTLDAPPALGLLAEHGSGFGGRPGLVGSRPDGSAWSPRFAPAGAPEVTADTLRFDLVDAVAGLRLELSLTLGETEALVIRTALVNTGDDAYQLQRLAPSIALPADAAELLTFGGRWCQEFRPERSPFAGTTVIENRRGRTSHDRVPALFAGVDGFGEHVGRVWGLQLAWSGNHELAAELLPDGRRHLQAGELLAPGEVVLAPGERYRAPELVVATGEGLTPVSQVFHRHQRTVHRPVGPRKVLLNTWEAVYFDHDLATLSELASVAAEVGVERFVLDDGWFGYRRDDEAGLGDWWVSPEVWPDGLHPLIKHVHEVGLDFGLWVEPEMVSPNSDLYRAHPDWALTTDGYEPVMGRQQLVLDCGREAVRQYLYDQLDALLIEYPIAYLKWDMNRDLVQGSGADGRAGAHGHVLGLYDLLDNLRAAHPEVEIESCASGGARADLGILARTDRVWTSDCNDALERQRIQHGFSLLFPPELMGAHLGPPAAHTTGRHQPLGFRLATALFGHLGIEWNLLETDRDERRAIAEAIEVHKRLRPLLHDGDVVRVDSPDPSVLIHGVVAPDRSRAVMAYVLLEPPRATTPTVMTFAGLDPEARYRVDVHNGFGAMVDFGRSRPAWMDGPLELSGAQLMASGLQPPVIHPESVLLIELHTVG